MDWKEPFIRFAKYAAKLGLMDAENIVVDDDLRRVYFTYKGDEYTIRMWNIGKNNRITDYTVYKTVPSEYGGTCGKTLYSGGNYELK